MGLSVVLSREQNVIHSIANKAGMSLASSPAYNDKPGSIAAHAQETLGTMGNIGNIVEQIAEQNGPAANDATFKGTALTAAVFAIGAVATAVAGPVAGQVALEAATAVAGKAAHMGLKSSVGAGEMTLANAAATSFENGVYISAADGLSTDIMTGKTVTKTPIGQAPAGASARGIHNLGAIAAEETAGMDKDDIRKDALALFREQQEMFNYDKRALMQKGVISANDPNFAAAEDGIAQLDNKLSLAAPKPLKALNVGMSGPGM